MNQKNKQPLLSLCIPTFNRREYLQKSIESIICQPEFQSGEVEIVISDNASTDGTESLGKAYASQYGNIRYFCNSENAGMKNFPLGISRGTGTFRRLSNDTFVYREGSLKYLCNLIKQCAPEKKQILFLNGQKEDCQEELISCDSFEQAIATVGYWLTWSGVFGIWGEECDGIENDQDGCDLYFWQTVKACKLINEKKSALICNKKLLDIQAVKGKDLSYGLYQTFYVNFPGILKEYVDAGALSREAYEKIRKDLLYVFFTPLIIVWETRSGTAVFNTDEDLKELLFSAYRNEPYWHEYEAFYQKQKTVFNTKKKIKTILMKLHIWDLLVLLHIKGQ